MGTDPFEEFEFKPLTEGLGFHRKDKAADLPVPGTKATASVNLPPQRTPDFAEETAPSSPLKAALPRKPLSAMPAITEDNTPSSSPVDDILKSLQKSRHLEIEKDRRQMKEIKNPKKQETFKPTVPSLSAGLLDGLLVTAASLLCMIIVLVVTKVDLLANLANPDTEGLVYAATACLFIGVGFIYTVINRIFLGFTPGEWAYDVRLGLPTEQGTAMYAGQVLLRQLLVTATGVFILPILSVIMKKDLAGKVTGLQLQTKA